MRANQIKNVRRARRTKRIRTQLRRVSDLPRLSVHRSVKHISAQIIDDAGGRTLAHVTTTGKEIAATLKGKTKTQRAALIGTEIAVRREELPPPEPGTYYWADLEGLTVVNLDGAVLGTVSHLFETGANDVLVVVDGERERLIPYTREAVKQVDLQARMIRVDWDPEF